MTSLLGRLLPLFAGQRRVEDLFTEAVARLFERQPGLCLKWLGEAGLISPAGEEEQRHVRVNTQKTFVRLDEHVSDSRPDMILEIVQTPEDEEAEGSTEVVMVESKIGSWEGVDQLERYAGHLATMYGDRKTLVYITRNHDPKDKTEIEVATCGVEFRQLRWHDFYKFLQTAEKDALTEEVMAFMEEQGMSRSHRFSTSDLMALSGAPRAFEIFDETLDNEVRAELEALAENRAKLSKGSPRGGWHTIEASLKSKDLTCWAGYYTMDTPDGFPAVLVEIGGPMKMARDLWVAAIRGVDTREE